MVKEIKVTPIKNGTVIDHIAPGMALSVLRIIGLPPETSTISILINAQGSHGRKDVVKIENKELDDQELDKIALVSPDATINIIRDFNVEVKHKVKLPEKIRGIARCGNPNCITNQKEPVEPEFYVTRGQPAKVRCRYCEREVVDISANLL